MTHPLLLFRFANADIQWFGIARPKELGLRQWQIFRSLMKMMMATEMLFMAQTVIKSSPRAVEILARVRSVKLCVPPSQRDTSASVFPVFFAKSRCDIPRSLSSLFNFSAMESEKRNCVLSSAGV